jgi:adenine-specific DNA-methyltransferase
MANENLSEQERKQLAESILAGNLIPAKYGPSILEGSKELELVWPGKSDHVEQIVLPFQSIEQIDEPREKDISELSLFEFDNDSGRQIGGWSNKLIWGDNKLILSSLNHGALRRTIEEAGGIKLIYIDPPFDVGYDFSMDIAVGADSVNKEPSVLEQLAYRDTWGKGAESFVNMLSQRLRLMHELLASDGSIFLHCDSRTKHLSRLVLDEIFGSSNFRSEIIWKKTNSPKAQAGGLGAQYDTILWYSKSEKYTFNQPYRSFDEKSLKPYSYTDSFGKFRLIELEAQGVQKSANRKSFEFKGRSAQWVYNIDQLNKWDETGYIYETGNGRFAKKQYFHEMEGVLVSDIWVDEDVPPLQGKSGENVDYPTQKPESLLNRIIRMGSMEGDIIADFFVGSGTTLAVAEKNARKWIGADIGRFSIHTSRKRLISVQRQRKENGLPFRSFEILNLGGYERQAFIEKVENPGSASSESLELKRREAFLELVLSAYGAIKSDQSAPFVGFKGSTAVFVGRIDSSISEVDVENCIGHALDLGISKIDMLGFEFEMGISPLLADRAKAKGLTLTLRYIPNEIFDSRAILAGSVSFFEVGYLEVEPEQQGLECRISLSDFGVFYRQADAEEVEKFLKGGSSKIIVDKGQVIKIKKSKTGDVERENITTKWEDWIDYWSVDFNFESRPEIIRVIDEEKEVEKKTGRFIFENEWQSFRTSKDRDLEPTSVWHKYPEKGTYKIAVKVIDIFGNDTTKVIQVKVG